MYADCGNAASSWQPKTPPNAVSQKEPTAPGHRPCGCHVAHPSGRGLLQAEDRPWKTGDGRNDAQVTQLAEKKPDHANAKPARKAPERLAPESATAHTCQSQLLRAVCQSAYREPTPEAGTRTAPPREGRGRWGTPSIPAASRRAVRHLWRCARLQLAPGTRHPGGLKQICRRESEWPGRQGGDIMGKNDDGQDYRREPTRSNETLETAHPGLGNRREESGPEPGTISAIPRHPSPQVVAVGESRACRRHPQGQRTHRCWRRGRLPCCPRNLARSAG